MSRKKQFLETITKTKIITHEKLSVRFKKKKKTCTEGDG